MTRLFIDQPLAVGRSIELPAAAAHHAVRVLRLRAGDALVLFNGLGGEYHARLEAADARQARVAIETFAAREAELPFAVTVAQGLSSGDKMDWTLEKAVELGAAAFQPLALARSVVRLTGERAEKRRAHWQALARAACEQCGRNRIPAVHAVVTLDAWLAEVPESALRLMLAPRGTQPLTALPRPAADQPVLLLVGPEGGLSPDEENAALATGFSAITLGPRILRTETAAAAALAMMAALWNPLSDRDR